jgi:hypothetical protein
LIGSVKMQRRADHARSSASTRRQKSRARPASPIHHYQVRVWPAN